MGSTTTPVGRWYRLSWWQLALLLLTAAGGTLLNRRFMHKYGDSATVIIAHALVIGVLVPYAFAYFLARLRRRSHSVFLIQLCWFAIGIFLISVFSGDGGFRLGFGAAP